MLEKHKFSGTNQKPERRRPFGTGLVRHCSQGLFSPFFTFLRATFFRMFRLSLVPTICPWVSEDCTVLSKGAMFENFFNLVHRVRVALSSGTGNEDLRDNPFQLEFSLVDHLSMSSRTRSQKVNKNGGKDSIERVFKLLLSVVNQIFCS